KFECHLWQQLLNNLGIKRQRTTNYHPQSNGMGECFHLRLKEAIKSSNEDNNWADALPMVLLYLRAKTMTDFVFSPAEMVYGQKLRIPGELPVIQNPMITQTNFLPVLQRTLRQLKFYMPREDKKRQRQVPASLGDEKQVLVRRDAVKKPLQRLYDGPFQVRRRETKFFTLDIKGRDVNVAIDRLKVADTLTEELTAEQEQRTTIPAVQEDYKGVPFPKMATAGRLDIRQKTPRTSSGREIKQPQRYTD
ncbi:Ribonuclease H-like domain, partial [Trinorchestia longiramus]